MGNYDAWKTRVPGDDHMIRARLREAEAKSTQCPCGATARMTGMLSRKPVCDDCGRAETRDYIMGDRRRSA